MGGFIKWPKKEKPPEITVRVLKVGNVSYETELEKSE